jgi:hypothetical protein
LPIPKYAKIDTKSINKLSRLGALLKTFFNVTGEQSAIRKAQNALKDKLKGLSTWEDFYNLLSFNGMKYQKKGSGAVISVGDVTVKAEERTPPSALYDTAGRNERTARPAETRTPGALRFFRQGRFAPGNEQPAFGTGDEARLRAGGIVKDFERKTRPPMYVEAARKIIETETKAREAKHWKTWESYKDHKKALETLIANEPAKPKVFGVKKWRTEHGEWESERDSLLESLNSDLELLGVKRVGNVADMEKSGREAVVKHERLKEYAAEEARRLHPDAAAIIREDDAKREREELARREAEEARAQIEKVHRIEL